MDTWTAIADFVTKLGFPFAVAAALLYGLHYWMVRLYRDIALPIVTEYVKLTRMLRLQLERATAALERLADRNCHSKPPDPE